MVKRFFHKPVKILGYSRQRIQGNWKLYAENLRDTYHASLLHEFFVTYGVDRATQKGGVKMDERHRHNMNHAYAASDSQEEAKRPTPTPRRGSIACGCATPSCCSSRTSIPTA